MENKINISFIKEEKNIEIDIQQPDLSNLVHKIIAEHLLVSETNIKISTDNDNFDKEEFLQMLIEVHQDFCEEIGTSTLSYFPLCEHLTNDKLTVFVNRGSINIKTK